MRRRDFLRAAALAVAATGSGGLLTACATSPERLVAQEPSLALQPATFFLRPGDAQRVVFGLTTLGNEPIDADEVDVWVLDMDDEVVGGPFPATYHAEAGVGRGLYLSRVDLPEGMVQLAAIADGDDHARSSFQIPHPEAGAVPAPGDDAVSVATPVAGEDTGVVSTLCTADPDCGMHDVSLDDALAAGRPVLLLFATPAHCQTAVCGPAVEAVDEIRAQGGWGDVAFVHCEIFAAPPGSEEGAIIAEPVEAWGLPSEPWLFAIDGEGVVRDRLDGAVIAEAAEEMARRLAG